MIRLVLKILENIYKSSRQFIQNAVKTARILRDFTKDWDSSNKNTRENT